MLCGDFNARIGNRQECNITEGTHGTLSNLLGNRYIDCDEENIALRYSKDKVINMYGHEFLDFCKGTRFITMNGRIHDKNGLFTYYHPHTGCSVIDYLLVHAEDINLIDNFCILSKQVE